MSETVTLSVDEVHALAKAALLQQGFADNHATAIANTVTMAERDECRHHGLFRMPFYMNGLWSGQASPSIEPVLTRLAPSVIRVDAGYSFSPLALEAGDAPLAELAQEHGIAALSVVNALNVAALWPEVERLAQRGLVGFAFVAAAPYVAPAGGTRPLYGTNPMAFSWPRDGLPPVVFDQASSASARGEIQIRLRDGKTLPDGWAIGPDGQPTNDPKEALAGAQLPFGGFKGSNIAMMVELLAGPLLGDVLSFEAGARDTANTGAPCGGELVIAMDPAKFLPGGDRKAQLAHAEMLFERITGQTGARLPADRRYEARARSAEFGVKVPKVLHETILSYAAGQAIKERQAYEGDHLTHQNQAR
ncbi:Ldh family oxidoreductase [Rhodovarius crocodyli]|uniref:Ldh family oxidoreductase n=1 Tax=Rhodovarius crocodyli TaxID=1979269 RepID=A0A437MGM3_9PROT|nr:Ldh family oxidoreductase [Rhodovarius crocodyli]RVT96803.1 Ldh family oxidoreductase [Rhodovarius crocodyli]